MRSRFINRYLLVIIVVAAALSSARAQSDSVTGGSLIGIVEDQKGDPVPEVKVTVINRLTNMRVTHVLTDTDGKFHVTRLSQGQYTIIFFSPSFQRSIIRSVRIKSGHEKRLKHPIRLKPLKQEAIINGAVFDPQGRLVPGARVRLERIPLDNNPVPTLKKRTTANRSGEFAFRLPAVEARYRLTASAKGFRSQSKIVDVGGIERRHVSLELEPKP